MISCTRIAGVRATLKGDVRHGAIMIVPARLGVHAGRTLLIAPNLSLLWLLYCNQDTYNYIQDTCTILKILDMIMIAIL